MRRFGSAEIVHACKIFADDVELNVDNATNNEVMKVGVFEGIGNDAHLKCVGRGTADCQGYTIDGDTSFVHAEIAASDHVVVAVISERKLVRPVLILYGYALRCTVHMSLYDVAVQTAVHEHGTFYIDFISNIKMAYITAFQRLAHGGYGIGAVLPADNGQTHAVVCHALVYTQFLNKGT